MHTPDALAALDRAVDDAKPEDFPAILGHLERVKAHLWSRMVVPSQPVPVPEEKPDLISPERAASIAGLIDGPQSSGRALKRIYQWARGQRWAHRPNRKTLLIDEQKFRRWLVTRN
jgi:hypothetical protein